MHRLRRITKTERRRRFRLNATIHPRPRFRRTRPDIGFEEVHTFDEIRRGGPIADGGIDYVGMLRLYGVRGCLGRKEERRFGMEKIRCYFVVTILFFT